MNVKTDGMPSSLHIQRTEETSSKSLPQNQQNIHDFAKNILNSPNQLELHLHEKAVKQLHGTIDYTYQKPEPEIPDEIKTKLTPAQLTSIKKVAMAKYAEAMLAMEDSYADVAIEDPSIQQLVREATSRLLLIVESLAIINCKKAMGKRITRDQVVLESNQLLANLYLKGREKEWGYTGQIGANPLALRKALNEGNFRESMMLIRYMADDFIGTILSDPILTHQINKELKKQEVSWQIHNELIPKPEDITHPEEGNIYHCGIYAQTNLDEKQRIKMSSLEAKQWKKLHNPTIKAQKAEGRIPISDREQRYWTKEPITRASDLGMQLSWDSGAAWIRPATIKDNPKSKYLQAADALQVPLLAGASGTADKILTQLEFLGFNTKEELYAGRLAALGWLIDAHSHTAHEILFASKSFGLLYAPGPKGYATTYPNDPDFVKKLEAKQRSRGFELPDYYLSKEYINQLAGSY